MSPFLLTLSWRSSTTCCMQSFTSQESVFSTSSGASGFSYSESIPVKPTEHKTKIFGDFFQKMTSSKRWLHFNAVHRQFSYINEHKRQEHGVLASLIQELLWKSADFFFIRFFPNHSIWQHQTSAFCSTYMALFCWWSYLSFTVNKEKSTGRRSVHINPELVMHPLSFIISWLLL